MNHTVTMDTDVVETPGRSEIISSHATSEGFVVYYRLTDGSLEVVREPRPVMPKRAVLPAA